MVDQCQGKTSEGNPCGARPRPGRPWCAWHDPELANRRQEWSQRGGRARSNRARAAKQLPGVMTNDELLQFVGLSVKGVLSGRVEPGVANAVANLARAYVTVRESGAVEDLAQRLDELERLAARGRLA